MEVRVEDPHLGDPVDGQAVALGGAADRLGVGAVVDAEGLAPVVGDVGVDPGDAFAGVDLDYVEPEARGPRLGRPRWGRSYCANSAGASVLIETG